MLQKVKFAPGFNKQVTSTGGESQWVNGDNVRFRYGTPEKIGGWSQLGSIDVTGRNTALHHFVNTSGIKYAVLGTNRILYAYSGGIFYDIHPIKATTTLTSAFSTTNGFSANAMYMNVLLLLVSPETPLNLKPLLNKST